MDQRMLVVAQALLDVALCQGAWLSLEAGRPAQQPRLDLRPKTKAEMVAHARTVPQCDTKWHVPSASEQALWVAQRRRDCAKHPHKLHQAPMRCSAGCRRNLADL